MAEDKREPLKDSNRLTASMANWEGTTTEQVKAKSGIRDEGVKRFKAIMDTQTEIDAKAQETSVFVRRTPAVVTPPAETPTQTENFPATTTSTEVPATAPSWLKREQARLTPKYVETALGQGPVTPAPDYREQVAQRGVGQMVETKTQAAPTPAPAVEQVAAKQSIAQGQEIKRRWTDRIPFLKILRGEAKPNG